MSGHDFRIVWDWGSYMTGFALLFEGFEIELLKGVFELVYY